MFIAANYIHKTPRPAVISGILREGQIATLCGPFSSGKSPVLMDWAVAVATGMDWCGAATSARPVVMIDYESPEGGFYHNLCNIVERRVGVTTPVDITPYLRDNPDGDNPFSVQTEGAIGATMKERLAWIEHILTRHMNALVIIDPIQIPFDIDKNKSSEVTELFTAFRRFRRQFPGSAFIFVFNLKKDGNASKPRPPLIEFPHEWLESISGSMDLQNRADVRLGMEYLSKAERDVFVVNGILRGESSFEPFVLEVDYLPMQAGEEEPRKAGFKRVEASTLDIAQVMPPKPYAAWMGMDVRFTVKDAQHISTSGTAYRMIKLAKRYGLIRELEDGVYEKIL